MSEHRHLVKGEIKGCCIAILITRIMNRALLQSAEGEEANWTFSLYK